MIDAAQHFSSPPPMPNLSVPPPLGGPPNLSMPPPSMAVPPPNVPNFNRSYGSIGGTNNSGDRRPHFFTPYRPFARPGVDPEFDGKRLRKSVMRKTVDYNAAIIKMLETRVWQRDFRDRRALQPDVLYYPDMQPPRSYEDNAMNAVTTRFVKTATNKMRCPVFCMAWTPEGRRLVTGASSGEFTLWNGLTFNFETILQAHDSPVRTMVWSHNEQWMVTADHAGYVKYWQSNMNNVKMFQGHKEAVRGISFSPSDSKFATCSDDGTIRIWDFFRCHEERILRGHGADVKCVDWHPQKGLIVSGSKDNQQPVKLWDPKTGQSLATLHAHKNTVMDVKWNSNGNWLVTASRDHLLKLFDIRKLNQELQTFRGHKKESSSVAWHPYHEGLFASGGSDGAILFWHVGADKEVGAIEQAHDSIVWTLAWHPLGHILCSGSNDHTSKFWTRNRPGDQMRDKYNLNTMPAGLTGVEDVEQDESSVIPGMGPDDKVEASLDFNESTAISTAADGGIPGLDFEIDDKNKTQSKKVPYSKPIPRNFQAQWNDTARQSMDDEDSVDVPSPFPGIQPSSTFQVFPKFPSEYFEAGKPIPYPLDEYSLSLFYEEFNVTTENGDDGDWGSGDKDADQDALAKMIQQIVENVPGVVPVNELEPTALIVYGKVINVEREWLDNDPDLWCMLVMTAMCCHESCFQCPPTGGHPLANSALSHAISSGQEAVYKLISSGAIEDLMNDIAHDENTPYLHEDPSVDAELRELQAVELPRRPPLLSTPQLPPHRQGERKARRERKRDRRRGHDDDRRSNGTQEDDDRMDDYYDDDYDDPDDTEEIHQRFMGEEEEWAYNDNQNYEDDYAQHDSSARKFTDEDAGPMGDRDLRSIGGPSGMPGDMGYIQDHDQRRLPPPMNQGEGDMRAMPRMGDQDLRGMPPGFAGGDRDLRHPGLGPDFQGERDFRQPLLNHQADQRMHGRGRGLMPNPPPGPHGGPEPYPRFDPDHRRSGPKDDNYRRHSGGKYHEYDDEPNNDDDYMRSGHGGPRHRGRWGGSGGMGEEDRNDEDEAMRWGQPNRGSPRGRGSPSVRRGRRGGGNDGPLGPAGPGAGAIRQDWEKRRGGLLETPPHMDNSSGRRPWDDGGVGDQDQEMDEGGRGGFRGGRGGWFGGRGGMEFGRNPGRGRGGWQRGSAPRGRGGWQRGRN